MLRTNDTASPTRDIFLWYKRRWRIETFYNFFSKVQYDEDFQQRNYYKVQGFAFVLLVSSLIHREFSEQLKEAGISIGCPSGFEDGQLVKRGAWKCENRKPSYAALLERLATSLAPEVTA